MTTLSAVAIHADHHPPLGKLPRQGDLELCPEARRLTLNRRLMLWRRLLLKEQGW